jgi:predicted DNA-binding transcriptional regulator AlpA
MDGLLSAKEAAKFLGFCEVTLAKWRESGKGPAFIKIGRTVRYDPAILRAFIAQRVCTNTGEGGQRAATV